LDPFIDSTFWSFPRSEKKWFFWPPLFSGFSVPFPDPLFSGFGTPNLVEGFFGVLLNEDQLG
jgi:hypothetical protein